MQPLSFIDVSGVGNAGKSAVVDLLREIDGLWVPEYWFEFDFLRMPGGLLDFRHALVDDWSPVRSHDAYLRFRKLVCSVGVDPRPWQVLALLTSTSQRYDGRFRGEFVKMCLSFADSFLVGTFKSEWPYQALRDGPTERFARKALSRLNMRRFLLRDVHLLDGSAFDERAAALLTGLYRTIVPPETRGVVFNNGFEPFHPQPALSMLGDARQLVVTRDPRDIYVSGQSSRKVAHGDRALMAFDNDGVSKSFLATDDIVMFVKRYRHYQDRLGKPDQRVLRVNFEEITRDYAASVARILGFLGIDPARHVRPRTSLDPEKSGRNVGIWKSYSRRDEIDYIERELSSYLVND